MESLLIRDIEPELSEALRRQAAEHGRSMQDEVKTILQVALIEAGPESKRNLYERIRARFEPLGGVALDLPPRDLPRDPPSFD